LVSSHTPGGDCSTPSLPQSKKPAKPYPDFPLSPPATRQWTKKIEGEPYHAMRV
jgi:hypothetical protein